MVRCTNLRVVDEAWSTGRICGDGVGVVEGLVILGESSYNEVVFRCR